MAQLGAATGRRLDARLQKNMNPSDDEIKEALAENLSRCGTHVRILRAVKRAAASL